MSAGWLNCTSNFEGQFGHFTTTTTTDALFLFLRLLFFIITF
uniref:Uncharacterized protein n=1 Tax=Rhizophora mucronata TaxID=61149 RepID=A0A2P2QPV4_RHIMU